MLTHHSITLVLTSHDGGNHVTVDCSFVGRKSSLVSRASTCELKGYGTKSKKTFMSFVVTSQLRLTPKLLNWHHRCFHDCNYEEFEKTSRFS